MPFIVVQARVNGEGPYPFMVDTGVSYPLIIAKNFVPLLKLKANHDHSIANNIVKLSGVNVQTLDILTFNPADRLHVNFTGAATTAYVLDMDFLRDIHGGAPLAGVIGATVLAAMTERIDFARGEITFYEQPHAPLQLPGTACLPLHNNDDRYSMEVTAEDGATTPLLVDTGALLTTLPSAFRTHLRPIATILDGHETVGSFTLGSRWLLPSLRLGTWAEPDVAATVEEGQGVLGLDLLSRFVMFLDCRNQQLLLQHATDYDLRRRLLGWTGIQLSQGNQIVEHVDVGSPADKAGVRAGDRLLTLDGQTLAGTSTYLAQKRLDGRAGRTLLLTLQRDKAPVQTVSITRGREFDSPPRVLDGVRLYKADKSFMEVREVAPGSVAERAGLRSGDHILKLNGVTTKTLTGLDFWEKVRTSSLLLEVEHAGEKRAQTISLMLPPTP